MAVIFETITFRNIYNIREETVKYDNQGLVLVTGRNGAGKSSLFIEGPYYLAYGKSFKLGDRPADEIICDHAPEDEESLMMGWMNVDEVRYQIVRARRSKKYNKGLSVFSEAGADLSRGTADETQEWLNELMGMGPDTFKYSVVFNHEILKFPLLGDAEKKKVFDEILQLDAFSSALAITRAEVNECKMHKKNAADACKDLKERMVKLESDFQSATLSMKTWEAGRDSRVEGLCDALEMLEAELTKARASLDRAIKAEEAAIKKVDEEDVSPLEAELREREAEVADCEKVVAEKRATISTKMAACSKDIKRVEGLVDGGNCPQCGTPSTGQHPVCHDLADSKNALAELKAKLEKVEAFCNTDMVEMRSEVSDIKEKIRKAKEKSRATLQEVERVKDEKRHATTAVVRAEGEVQKCAAKLASEREASNPYVKLVESHKEMLQDVADEHAEAVARLATVTKKLVDEEVLEKVFSNKGAKLTMLQEAIPLLNAEAARIQAIMDVPIGAKFSLKGMDEARGGTFNIEVFNPKGSKSYKGDSSGEKSCVDLILLLSLLSLASNRGRKNFSQSFFDEAFDKLDDVNETAVLRVLQDIAKNKSAVFVLSHSAEAIGGQVDKVWTVEEGKVVK